ncbi:M14 family metallopeptidase [Maribacter chungangensis]|uniref:M14 family metallopeptidase n=1 Tax=Maribacter chungangensis TaxID=1069117 RepID=A0ABW3B5I8_9FLAO
MKTVSFRLFIVCTTIFFLSCEKRTTSNSTDLRTPFETSKGKETATYQQTIEFYIKLAKGFPEINIQTIGNTDSGNPLHIVTYNPDGDFNYKHIHEEKTVILINNGIHPGESDGIDATMLLFRDLANEKIDTPVNTVLVTIPIYNIGGSLNRNSNTRANQNGPESYGFRGNARNYDLNRDFIKSDTKNAKTFAEIYHLVKPDIFIDNHVSNGADYQYTLTHLFTQHNKLAGETGSYLHKILMPALQDSLSDANWDITPYVNVFNRTPETGFQQFMDHPRYSTGYTTLWNTLGMMVETHMLKPYKERVNGTYLLMKKMIGIAEKEGKRITEIRKNALTEQFKSTYYPIAWQVDTSKTSQLNFKGYKADTVISKITGFNRLKYNRKAPFTKKVVYQDHFIASDSIKIPKAYIIGKQWVNVIDLLQRNKIEFTSFKKDTIIDVEIYKIADYKTVDNPYEGHYLHYNTQVKTALSQQKVFSGDLLVHTDQAGIRYVLETLEPAAVDSFFNWNFFDTILQQKEGFSPYVFEDTALLMLENDSVLKKEFELKKQTEKHFSDNWYAQLSWLFKRSKHYEEAHMKYPIYRLPK